jgi:hypothetical protein
MTSETAAACTIVDLYVGVGAALVGELKVNTNSVTPQHVLRRQGSLLIADAVRPLLPSPRSVHWTRIGCCAAYGVRKDEIHKAYNSSMVATTNLHAAQLPACQSAPTSQDLHVLRALPMPCSIGYCPTNLHLFLQTAYN